MAHISSGFKAEFPFERRVEVAQKIRVKYPDRVPVIVEKVPGADVPACTKRKFLVPCELTIGSFIFEVRKHMPELDPHKAIFLFVGDQFPASSSLMSELYEKHKDVDGFVYLTYSGENTFGF
eukprot:TRINITY_DN1693_c0_g1_i2.p3 TRINITY_DN1693_c0_g1~~TRINITY_DN1693_c0_g1_i2.p3  ORF type:complete len:122 (-),score=16.61 TRINITY_DN1693_c0_g1_i2:53-418(-)